MRYLATRDRPNCGCLHGGNCGGPAIERRELDFERIPIRVDVNHCADVAYFEALSRYGLGQNDSIVLPDQLSPLPGYAVTSRGVSPPRSIIQTVRTDHRLS
jgi:hypothetical protein